MKDEIIDSRKEINKMRRRLEDLETQDPPSTLAIAYQLLHSGWLNFPGIVGLWNTHYSRSAVNDFPNVLPVASGAPSLTLTGSAVTRNRVHNIPTWLFVSSESRYLSRTDITTLSFIGVESQVSASDQGMVIGGWFHPYDEGNWGVDHQGLVGKWGASGNLSYLLRIESTKKAQFYVSSNGTVYDNVPTPTVLDPDKWYFIVGSFRTTSGDIEVYVNGNQYSTASGYSSIFDSTAAFRIGSYDATPARFYDGLVSGIFACGMHASKAVLDFYYNATKGIFASQGVLGDPP